MRVRQVRGGLSSPSPRSSPPRPNTKPKAVKNPKSNWDKCWGGVIEVLRPNVMSRSTYNLDLVSLTHPNPVLNRTKSRSKYQSLGLTLLNARSSWLLWLHKSNSFHSGLSKLISASTVKVSAKISLSSKLQYLMKSSQLLTLDILLRTAPGVCNLVPVSANQNPGLSPVRTNQKPGSAASIEAQLLANWSLPLV